MPWDLRLNMSKLKQRLKRCSIDKINGNIKESLIDGDRGNRQYILKHLSLVIHCKFLQIFLFLYVITAVSFSLLVADSKLWIFYSDKSFEEIVFFKLIWCFTFGVITDLSSWRFAFKLQGFFWMLLSFSYCFIPYPSITKTLTLMCSSSSFVIVFYIGVVKLFGELKCIRYFALAQILLYLFRVGSRILHLQNISDSLILSSFALGSEGLLLLSVFLCAFCLILVTLSEERPKGQKSLVSGEKNHIVKPLLLGAFLFIPSNLTLLIYNSGLVNQSAFVMPFLSIAIQLLHMPDSSRHVSLMALLTLCTCLLGFVHLLMGFLGGGSPWLFFSMCALTSFLQPVFDAYFICQLPRFPGTAIGILVSSHLIVRFVCDIFYISILSNGLHKTLIYLFTAISEYVPIPALWASQFMMSFSSYEPLAGYDDILFVSYIGSFFALCSLCMLLLGKRM